MNIYPFVLLHAIVLVAVGVKSNTNEMRGKQQYVSTNEQTSADSLSILPEGTVIFKRTAKKVYCFLPKDTIVQGVLCRGGDHDWMTEFYYNGKLAQAWLGRDEKIQGIPCMKASFWTEVFGSSARVLFYENGRLKQCKLAEDLTIQKQKFEKGDVIYFDPNGKLIKKR